MIIKKNIENIPIIIIAGATASGKSSLAMHISRKLPATIINCDSMQVYKDLKIITARPNNKDCKEVQHELYGILDSEISCSALFWRDMAVEKIKQSIDNNKAPIIVGGTGFYIQALIDGINSVPKSLPEYRNKAEEKYKKLGIEKFYQLVKSIDHNLVNRVSLNDYQRLIRSYCVWLQTGKSLSDWQNEERYNKKFFKNFFKIRLIEERKKLREKISERFFYMLKKGATKEVEKIRNIDQSLPIMKAHGVRELLDFNSGKISLEEASE